MLNFISGPTCMLYNQQFPANPTGTDSLVNSPADCQTKCQQLGSCGFYSFKNGNCYLRSVLSNTNGATGYVSGNKYCEGKYKMLLTRASAQTRTNSNPGCMAILTCSYRNRESLNIFKM